ncbi:hypothetical protein FVB13_07880 [Escherichia coli]|uniref:hypothetical protein n=1 Tax=Escherichia coli TaxID=562 RepID=UPI00128CF321|nr:hypothetical protein [Escherichia coli]MPU29130.1 hypothetical protein [Escherichia coli]MPU39463.1 hypothetical protein [Escherichia coli]
MIKAILWISMLVVVPFSAFCDLGKFHYKAAELIAQQQFTEWEHYASAKPFVAMNGRPFAMTLDDFVNVVKNTFHQCDDMEAYTNRQGAKDSCQEYIYKGVVEWVNLSKDSSVSPQAWKMGTQYAYNTRNPIPGRNSFDFNGWAAGIRVAKSKGY